MAALAHGERLLGEAPVAALEQANEIARSLGADFPEARALKARAFVAMGLLEDAARAIEAAKDRFPGHASLLLAEAELELARGDAARAQLLSRRAVLVRPELAAAWLLLAKLSALAGDSDSADAAYLSYVRYGSGNPLLMAAADALTSNRIPEAESRLRSILRTTPTDVAAIRMLAEVAARIGRYEDAESLLRRCLELAPGFAAARRNLATVLHRANKPEAALAELDRLLAGDPCDPGSRNLKAVVLCRIGEYEPAIQLYEGILEEHPQHARIWLSFGHALKTAGLRDRAIAAYRRCLELEPSFGEAWWSLANLKTFRFESADVETMQGQLRRTDLPVDQRCQFEFALGKAFEDRAEYAVSFEHYASGNRRRRAMLPYRQSDASARVTRSVELFTPEFLASRAGSGSVSRDPIFVVGLPRSGSTLVEQILSSHPDVEGTMELPEVISITRDLRQRGEPEGAGSYHEVLAGMDADALRELGEHYLQRTRIQRKTSARHFIDKMPNNFFHVGLIHLMLPNARIIDVRRHPLACCFSGFKQYFARGQNFSYGLEDIGAYYRDYVRLMQHFDAVLPGRVHRVIYEHLVDDFEAEVRRLLAYCGLPWNPACLRFFENDRPVRTASSEQVRRPIYREGIDHWRHFESWLAPLKKALGPVLDAYPDVPATFASGVEAISPK